MMNDNLTFEKVLATFHNYLAQDDCVEVVKTSRGYAVIEWDNRLDSWTEIEHCPLPAVLHENLLNHMVSFLEYGYTSGERELTKEEKTASRNKEIYYFDSIRKLKPHVFFFAKHFEILSDVFQRVVVLQV